MTPKIFKGHNNEPKGDGGESPDEPPRSPDQPASPDPPQATVGQRVDAVLEAAEQAAADIRRTAEDWAERHMEETRRKAEELSAKRLREMNAITDDLLTKARTVAKQSDSLIAALEEAGGTALAAPSGQPKVSETSGSSDAGEAPKDAESPKASEPVAKASEPSKAPDTPETPAPVLQGANDPKPDEPEKGNGSPPSDGGGVSEGARLLATQMSVAGSSRDTIAARLREEFGIKDPSAILDDAGL
jgi:vacuolar-type H+-ATPase subunit H